MKLYARRGYEWAEDGLVGLWSPVSTGTTQGMLLDCNLSTNNNGTLTGYGNFNTGWLGSPNGTIVSSRFNANSYVQVALSTPATQQISFGGWFAAFTDSGGFASTMNRGNVTEISIRLQTPVRIDINTSSSNTFFNPLDGILRHYFATWNGTTLIFYVNGVENARFAVPGTLAASSTPLVFFNNITGTQRPGGCDMYESLISYRTWTSTEVASAFFAQPGGMWQDRPRAKRSYFAQVTTFKNYWFRNQQRMIGGGIS